MCNGYYIEFGQTDQAQVAGDAVELILVRKTLTNNVLICPGVKKHVMYIPSKVEGIDKACIFIRYLGGGHVEILQGNCQDVDIAEALVRKEGRCTHLRMANTCGRIGSKCCRVSIVYSP